MPLEGGGPKVASIRDSSSSSRRRALVLAVGQVVEVDLDLGPELVAQDLGIDRHAEPLGRPLRQAVAVVAGLGRVLRLLLEVAGQADLDGKLGLLAGVEGTRLAPDLLDDLHPRELAPTTPRRGRGRTCGGPSRPAIGGPSRATRYSDGRREVHRLHRLAGLLDEEIGQAVAVHVERRLVVLASRGRGELAEVAVLEVQAVLGVGPGRQRQPVVFRRLGVRGQVLLDRLADQALGAGLGRVRGVVASLLEGRALELLGGELDAELLARVVGEAGLRRSRRPGTGSRRS